MTALLTCQTLYAIFIQRYQLMQEDFFKNSLRENKKVSRSVAGTRHIAYWVRICNSSTGILSLPGASVRHSAHDKGHEEGGSAYAKAGSSLRSPPGNSRASTPKPESAYFLLCAFTYTSDFTGGCLPLPLSGKRVSLQLQLIIPGCDSV